MVFVLIAQVAAVALLASSCTNAQSSIVPPPPESAGAVFTAVQIYDTIIANSPYLTQATSTVTWTESALPSTTASST
ncbi:hypothetical protein FIBSPDRAFT_967343 [Athelia psychrophila]|uniref:Uncharacterized protein n=1 Tax=Athelia psychrophila TaxID=1759441 RepID=A0A167VTY1_9AGAM|nr:hypothetical protein FIBSPDRAFT_967343 [Fibularhizoctonia sp. CBS 109695]